MTLTNLLNLFIILGRGGFRGGKSVVVEPHRHEGKSAVKNKNDTGTSKHLLGRGLSLTFYTL